MSYDYSGRSSTLPDIRRKSFVFNGVKKLIGTSRNQQEPGKAGIAIVWGFAGCFGSLADD
jgi:hypothetical protein